MFNNLFSSIAIVVLLTSPALALDFEFGPYFDGVTDITSYINSNDGDSMAATGLCSGTLVKVMNDGEMVGSLFSPCALGGLTYSGDAESALLIGASIINVMGLHFSVFRDTTNTDWTYGIGISLSGLGNQLVK